MGILEEHIEGDALGQQVWEGFGGGHPELDVIALTEGGFWPDR